MSPGPRSNGAARAGATEFCVMRTLLTALVLAGLLAGCAASKSDDWAKPGATQEQMGRDTADCLLQAQIVQSGPQGPRTTIMQDQYRECMTTRGYTAGPAK